VKKRLFILIFTVAWVCRAQEMGAGMEFSGFRVPDYDSQGKLRAQLFGEYARVLQDDEVKITNLKIEMYKDGKVAMTVFLPECFFNTESRLAKSEGLVLIESESMSITGRGFIWSAAAGRFEILHDSKVLVKDTANAGLKDLNP
jgi:hypothetical protein